MKTAREWFQCLRPDLRDRAIKATTEKPLQGAGINIKYRKLSDALLWSFEFCSEGGKGVDKNHDFWTKIRLEALDIEEGRKPDIK